MTPRTPRTKGIGLPVVALVAALAAIGMMAAVHRAAAQDDQLNLRGMLQQQRAQLLRQEFRERQMEVKESLERFHHPKKFAHGKHAEVAPVNDDFAGSAGAAAARAAGQLGARNVLSTPTNVQVNNKSGDAAGAGQAEQSPVFIGLNGLCAWNNGQGFNNTPADVQAYGYTTNGGATWTTGGVPLKGGTIATWTSDPSVTANEKTGYFYYTGLTSNTGTNNNGVAVARGHFAAGTFTWDAATVVSAGPSSSAGYDKEWMCADSLTGNLYSTFTIFTTTGDNVWFSRSTDNGATWSAPIQISGSWENGYVSGSRPCVGPNGEVYVVYSAIGPVDADSMKIAKSTNGGASFSPAVVAMTEYDNYYTGGPGFNRARAVTFPSVAVDRSTGPNRGRVYMTVQDCVDIYNDTFGSTANANSKSEVENNNNYANATPFTVGQTLRGALSSTTDQDIWKFSAVQGSTYLFFVDSLRTTSFRYSMRIYCPNDTTVVSRLAFSGDASTSDPTDANALIAWTAPTTNTYYLRFVEVSSTGGYRVRTTTHVPTSLDVARDQRDVTVASSADGQTGWTPRKVINDDQPLYDNWLPEVAVPCDGNVYAMWFDWRDTPSSCFGGSNIYLTRSTDAGATWAPNQVATTTVTANWTQVLSNIAPNEGDYNGMYGGDNLALAWADGRTGDADIFAARVTCGFTLACPGDQTLIAGTGSNNNATVSNLNQMFGNSYNYTVSTNVSWPGYPYSGSTSAAALANGTFPVNVNVPPDAPDGQVARFCVTTSMNGACAQSCCFNVTALNPVTGALASLVSSSADDGHVSVNWMVISQSAVNVYRNAGGAGWTLLGSYSPNSQGEISVTDNAVQGGTRYGYRVGVMNAGHETIAGETWVNVPIVAEFALSHVFPNPASSGFSISFSLPSGAPATLDVIDLSGRRVLSRQVGTMGAGQHTLSLTNETSRLPIGVYGIRLTQGHSVAKAKVSVIR